MKTMYRYLLAVFTACCLTACDEVVQMLDDNSDGDFLADVFGENRETMKVLDVKFSPDYKTFTMTTNVVQDIGQWELKDSTKNRTEVVETLDGFRHATSSTPRLLSIKNVEADRVYENGIRLLALVDLSLPQADIDRTRYYVGEMRTVFNHDNLFVAFMDGQKVSETMKVTDYVLNNYFKKSSTKYVWLYRSLLQKKQEMTSGADPWKGARRLVMVTFAQSNVYDDDTDEPFDPQHYQYEEQLVQETAADSTFTAFFAGLHTQEDTDEQEENVIGLFCNKHGGSYMHAFNFVALKKNIYAAYNLTFPDNEFLFENPDHKVYRGDRKHLTLNFYNIATDSLIASASTNVEMGTMYSPIIVHGHSMPFVLLQGLMLGVLIFLMAWIVLQFLVPYIRYRLFLHRYITTYTGPGMSFGQKAVGDCCYLCKAPFEVGDDIVVKCEHTMHKSCWDENEYHCPEYSDRCKHGSHYYNRYNLVDGHNAPFFMKWLLIAIAAATMAWLCFSIEAHQGFKFYPDRFLHPPVSQMPTFGLAIGFFLTAGLTILAIRPRTLRHWLSGVLLRAVIAAIGCYLSFLMVNLVILLFDINTFTFLLNWIPWAASAFIIAYCSTFGTRIVHNKWLVLGTVGLSFVSMYAWAVLFKFMELDYRVSLLYSFIIYAVGLAACIATVAPRSERYFLKVEGAAKGMDIALYKWFRNQPERVVTIGKSVDCTLQLSWDIQGDVAPVHADIRMSHSTPYLSAIEPGIVVNGKPLDMGERVRLHHGKSFTIGMTTFTYIEKDR